MKILAIVALSLSLLIFPSCKFEEERVADRYISMSEYILNKATDAELSFLMSSDDWSEMENTISMMEYAMNKTQSLDKIHDIGFYSVYITFYGSVFLFNEDEKRELISDLEFKYPEITQRLLEAPSFFETLTQNT